MTEPPLPPAVAALPQSVRDAMGRAVAAEIVERLHEMTREFREGGERDTQGERRGLDTPARIVRR
ncbi:MAG: hypothetical protein H0U59_06120 [Gemmatimonadaceae bacterium]|nr:hypothetical protein [Gemmatimonadaceae bacterium]